VAGPQRKDPWPRKKGKNRRKPTYLNISKTQRAIDVISRELFSLGVSHKFDGLLLEKRG
jgi:hypothetical protein